MGGFELRNFLCKKRVCGKLFTQAGEQSTGALGLVISDVGDGQQNIRKRCKIMSMLRNQLQFFNSFLLVSRNSA